MAEQEKKDLEIEKLDATEVEDQDLEEVSGGQTDNNCVCSVQPNLARDSGS
jgi:ABC-type enterochelin transport system ATPase subunit